MPQQGPAVQYKLINQAGIRSVPARDLALRSIPGRSRQDFRAPRLDRYGIAVFNDTDKTVIAAVLRTTFVADNGTESVKETLFTNFRLKPAGGVTPNGNEIAARSFRILTPALSLSQDDPGTASISFGGSTYSASGKPSPLSHSSDVRELASQPTVVLALDLVMFEDGQLLGPDESNLIYNLEAQLQVERDMAQMISGALSSAKDIRLIREMLARKAKTDIRPRVDGTGAADHWRDSFTVLTSHYYLGRGTSREALVATIEEVLARPVLNLFR